MKHIVFSNYALTGTGGGRVILNLSEILSNNNYKISILVDRDMPIAFDIPDGVDIYLWGLFRIKKVNAPQHALPISEHKKNISSPIRKKISTYIKWIYYLIFTPLFIISLYFFSRKNKIDHFIQNNIYFGLERNYFVSKFLNFKFNFHNSPHEVFSRKDFKLIIKPNVFFKEFDCIGVSKDIIKELEEIAPSEKNELCCIYNPFNFKKIKHLANDKPLSIVTFKYFIAVSTLTSRKRIDRLIKSYYRYYNNHKHNEPYHLVIAGTGELKVKLSNLVDNLNLTKYIHFIGFSNNVYPWIKNSEGLILTSDSEGLPTVLIESLILEIPVISTDCPTGPSEILANNTDFLVSLNKPEQEIEEKISELMFNLENIIDYNYEIDEFSEKNILLEWNNILS